jgi:hypothetical protein
MSDKPLAREREPIERVRARLEALVRANAAPRCVLDHAVRDPFGLFVRVFCALGRLAVNPGPTFSDERETGRSREGSLQPKGESQSLQR